MDINDLCTPILLPLTAASNLDITIPKTIRITAIHQKKNDTEKGIARMTLAEIHLIGTTLKKFVTNGSTMKTMTVNAKDYKCLCLARHGMYLLGHH